MGNKIKLLTEEDLQIKNLLVQEGIIDNPRVERCGNWFNRKSEGSWGVKNLPPGDGVGSSIFCKMIKVYILK